MDSDGDRGQRRFWNSPSERDDIAIAEWEPLETWNLCFVGVAFPVDVGPVLGLEVCDENLVSADGITRQVQNHDPVKSKQW